MPVPKLPDNLKRLFQPRKWPTEEQIAAAHERGIRRSWSFNVPVCDHPIYEAVEVSTGWTLDVCLICGHATKAQCTHPEMEWNESGTLLRCVVCGHDGT